jgi:hypothetical protein
MREKEEMKMREREVGSMKIRKTQDQRGLLGLSGVSGCKGIQKFLLLWHWEISMKKDISKSSFF